MGLTYTGFPCYKSDVLISRGGVRRGTGNYMTSRWFNDPITCMNECRRVTSDVLRSPM